MQIKRKDIIAYSISSYKDKRVEYATQQSDRYQNLWFQDQFLEVLSVICNTLLMFIGYGITLNLTIDGMLKT